MEEHLWTVLADPAIPVTKRPLPATAAIHENLAQAPLRHRLRASARLVELILSVTSSFQLQQRDAFAYLTAAIAAHGRCQAVPSILPATAEC